jgi:hypothetical protein
LLVLGSLTEEEDFSHRLLANESSIHVRSDTRSIHQSGPNKSALVYKTWNSTINPTQIS